MNYWKMSYNTQLWRSNWQECCTKCTEWEHYCPFTWKFSMQNTQYQYTIEQHVTIEKHWEVSTHSRSWLGLKNTPNLTKYYFLIPGIL